jgi:hypothetical protein
MNKAVKRKLQIFWINCITLQTYGTQSRVVQQSLSEHVENIFPEKLND